MSGPAAPGAGVPPPDPRARRQHALLLALSFARAGCLLGALAALVVPGAAGARLATATVVLVAAVPLGRVGWLAIRWTRRRDRTYALAAAGLLGGVAVVGALI